MARDELSLFSYEILGLVGRDGASPHDLLRLAKRDRMLAWAGESQYYVEPKRLARLGYLETHKEPGRTRERTVYSLTGQGREAIRTYAGTTVRLTPLKSEPLLRLLLADLAGEGPVLPGLRDDIAELRAQLAEAEARAEALPHRRANLLLVNGFLNRLLDLHLELADAVERE